MRLDVRSLRATLGVSRAEFGRFLGVSEATIVRWESDKNASEPRGLQALLLRALSDAIKTQSTEHIGRVIRTCGLDHRVAVRTVLDVAG